MLAGAQWRRCCWPGHRCGGAAGRGTVAEALLAVRRGGAPSGRCWSGRRGGGAAGRGAVAERHREAAGRGAVAAEMLLAGRCWPRRHGGEPSGRSCKLTYALCGFGCQFELQLEEEIYDLYCISLRLYCKNRQIIIKQLLYFLFRSTRGMEQKPPLVIQKERLFRV